MSEPSSAMTMRAVPRGDASLSAGFSQPSRSAASSRISLEANAGTTMGGMMPFGPNRFQCPACGSVGWTVHNTMTASMMILLNASRVVFEASFNMVQ